MPRQTPPAPDPVPAGKIAPPQAPPPGTRDVPMVTYRCPHCPEEIVYRVNDETGLERVDAHLAAAHGIRTSGGAFGGSPIG